MTGPPSVVAVAGVGLVAYGPASADGRWVARPAAAGRAATARSPSPKNFSRALGRPGV